jgi:hypothetical protein
MCELSYQLSEYQLAKRIVLLTSVILNMMLEDRYLMKYRIAPVLKDHVMKTNWGLEVRLH